MKAIIHIGTLKTGSTSIQNSLFSNRELLLNRGIIYPDIGSNFQHWGLFTAFMDEHPSNFHILRDWGWGKEKSEKWSLEKLDLKFFLMIFLKNTLFCYMGDQPIVIMLLGYQNLLVRE